MSNKTLTKLPINKLEDDNIRALDTDFVTWLVNNIKENGLEDDPIVYKHPSKEGVYKIFDGHHRLAALRRLNKEDSSFWAEVPCVIRKVPKNTLELRIKQLIVNISRKQFTSADIAKNVLSFKNLGLTPEKIAERLGMSPAWVTSHLKLAQDGSEKLKDANRKKLILNSTAQQLANFEEKAQNKWVKKIVKAKDAAETAHEASRAEQRMLSLAFKKDRPKTMKARFPKPKRKKEMARLLADMYDIYKTTKTSKTVGPGDKWVTRIKDACRGVAFVYDEGDNYETILDDHFSIKRWFKGLFGADIEDDRWFE